MGGQIGVQKLRSDAANPNAIMPMVKRLKDRLPNVEFSRTIEVREEILRQLIDFEIDVAAIGRPPTDPRFETAFHRRLRAGQHWRAKKADSLATEDTDLAPRR